MTGYCPEPEVKNFNHLQFQGHSHNWFVFLCTSTFRAIIRKKFFFFEFALSHRLYAGPMNSPLPLIRFPANRGKRFQKLFKFTQVNIFTGEQEKNFIFFDLRFLATTIMFHMVLLILLRSSAAFWKKKSKFFDVARNYVLARGRKMSHKKASNYKY